MSPIAADPPAGLATAGGSPVKIGFFAVTPERGELTGLNAVTISRRTGVLWAELETPPGSGTFDWTETDEAIGVAQDNGYNMTLVVKVGNTPESVVNQDCYDAVAGAASSSDNPVGTLSSCPPRSTFYEVAWHNFIRALIRRYTPGNWDTWVDLSDSHRLSIQVENESASPTYWAKDLVGDGAAAAAPYVRLLRWTYNAKLAEVARNADTSVEIIATGFIHIDRIKRLEDDPSINESGDLFNNRNREFTLEVLRHPQYFDALDVHIFTYHIYFPDDWDKGIAWLRSHMRKNGYDIDTKPIYALEWTAAYLGTMSLRDASRPFGVYRFPYADDFVGASFFGDYSTLGSSGAGPYDVRFYGDYTGLTQRTYAVAVEADNVTSVPNTFLWTDDYVAGQENVWNGPVTMVDTDILLNRGVYVRWGTGFAGSTSHTASFGVGTIAYPSTTITVPLSDEEKDLLSQSVRNAYLNLDKYPTYQTWFDRENAIDYVKILCNMLELGITRFIHVQFHEWFTGYSWDDTWWLWHGVIRYTDAAGSFVKLPTFYSHNQLASLLGYAGISRLPLASGLRIYSFSRSSGNPTYVVWSESTGVPANGEYDGSEQVTVPDTLVDLAGLLGAAGVSCESSVRKLDSSNAAITETYSVGSGKLVACDDVPLFVTAIAAPTWSRMPFGGFNTDDDWTLTSPATAITDGSQYNGDGALNVQGTEGAAPYTPYGSARHDFTSYNMSGLTRMRYMYREVGGSAEYEYTIRFRFYSTGLTLYSDVSTTYSNIGSGSWTQSAEVVVGSGGAADWSDIERIEIAVSLVSGPGFPVGSMPQFHIDNLEVK